MPPTKKATKEATSASKGSSNRGSRVSSPLSTRRSRRYATSPLNPNRTLERELADTDREESDPEDQSDSDSEVEPLATRRGGDRIVSTMSNRPKAKNLRDYEDPKKVENKKRAINPEPESEPEPKPEPEPEPEPRTQNQETNFGLRLGRERRTKT